MALVRAAIPTVALRRAMAGSARRVWTFRAELATVAALLAGWAAVTAFVVALTRPTVWFLSAGLLLLSCVGWRLLAHLAWHGLYALTRAEEAGDA